MKFSSFHFQWLFTVENEHWFLIGFAGGRVPADPEARWLYSARFFFGLFRIELNWYTGWNNITYEECTDEAWDAAFDPFSEPLAAGSSETPKPDDRRIEPSAPV